MIVIVNNNLGNFGSVLNMFKKIGVDTITSSKLKDIEKCEKLVLPGIGSFNEGIRSLHELGLLDVLFDKVVRNKTPFLGICLGMQLLTESSQEGSSAGLGWIDAQTIRFNFKDSPSLKVPHMGWNKVYPTRASRLFKGLDADARFYFSHSYHVACRDERDVLARTLYGQEFVSAIEKENIMGVQFHPEKSLKYGMKLLENFAGLT